MGCVGGAGPAASPHSAAQLAPGCAPSVGTDWLAVRSHLVRVYCTSNQRNLFFFFFLLFPGDIKRTYEQAVVFSFLPACPPTHLPSEQVREKAKTHEASTWGPERGRGAGPSCRGQQPQLAPRWICLWFYAHLLVWWEVYFREC